jgi:hypothetical protein
VGKQEILGGIKEMQYLLIATVVVLKKLSGATQNKFHSLGLSLAHFKATCEENTFESFAFRFQMASGYIRTLKFLYPTGADSPQSLHSLPSCARPQEFC